MAEIFPSRRVRRTPYSPGVEAAGVKSYTVYNHMLLATFFDTIEADCAHLKRHVQVWDVACERQVSVRGPDGLRLMRMLSPRDIGRMADDQCYYLPVTDSDGGMLNDPVAIKLAEDHYWLSLADGDYLQFALGVATALGLDVRIDEPDVSPLAVQGPKADDLMARVFGDEVRDIRFFRYKRLSFEGQEFVVARSGWSAQGGYEIYVEGSDWGMPLWEALFAAGQDLNVRAGCPNQIERIESGLLSYGSDMCRDNSPLQAGLARFCNSPDDHIGKAALQREAAEGPARQIRAVQIEGECSSCSGVWPVFADGRKVGQIGSAIWSPDVGATVAIAMMDRSHWGAGTAVEVETNEGVRPAIVRDKFWN